MNTASDWLNSLLTTIRSSTQNRQLLIVLILPPQFVPLMPIFKSLDINSLVDYFVLKFYGNVKPDYYDYSSLFQKSAQYPQTSLLELSRTAGLYFDMCRTLIAKPPDPNSCLSSTEYISASNLNNDFLAAYTSLGWFGGYANLNFEADANSAFSNTALSGLRVQCLRSQNCFC
jgi:hypothetical protein